MMSDPGAERGPVLSVEREVGRLSEWQRAHLPCIHTGPGKEFLAWLVKNWSEPKPFSDLRRSSKYSETTLRTILNQYAVLGLVEITKDPFTHRHKEIIAASKLKSSLEEYADRIAGIIASSVPK
jgi:hypothetical protein